MKKIDSCMAIVMFAIVLCVDAVRTDCSVPRDRDVRQMFGRQTLQIRGRKFKQMLRFLIIVAFS